MFVNALIDDPSAKQLAEKFPFQYIPTSFFVGSDGTVANSYTGPLTAEEMKAQLDGLIAQ